MEEEREIELIDYINVIWKRKWIIIIPTICLAIITGIISFLLPPKWEIDCIIQPSKFLVQTEQGEFEEVVVTEPKQIAEQINQKSYNHLIAADLNLDIRKFPKLKAENIRDTKLVRISLKENDIEKGKLILSTLFNYLKKDLDRKVEAEIKGIDTQIASKKNSIKQYEISIRDIENQIELKKLQIKDKENLIKTKKNEIKKKENNIELKKLEIKSKEIEKDRIKKEIESYKNKLKISQERIKSIMKEMSDVKKRIDEIEKQQMKAIKEGKRGVDAISLLLYSNEIQQNLRYYNTLDEKLSNEKIIQENLNLAIRDKEEQLRQIDTQIQQINTQINSIEAEIDNINTEISMIKNDIEKIRNQINSQKNEIEKIRNKINNVQNEIKLLEDRKVRLDYAKLIKDPTPSLYPVSPKKKLNILIAGILGLMIFTMFAFFLEYIEKQKTKS